jgi:hypothetical protein
VALYCSHAMRPAVAHPRTAGSRSPHFKGRIVPLDTVPKRTDPAWSSRCSTPARSQCCRTAVKRILAPKAPIGLGAVSELNNLRAHWGLRGAWRIDRRAD